MKQKKVHNARTLYSLLDSSEEHEDIFSYYSANETNPVFLLAFSQTHSDLNSVLISSISATQAL